MGFSASELEEISLGNIKVDIQKVYPELEDLEVTPKLEEQKFKSSKYGYNQVIVKGTEGIIEDLSVELTEQDNLLSEQEITIEDIIEALEGKSSVENITPKVEGNVLILSSGNVEGGVLNI
jgi:hypothetical protein